MISERQQRLSSMRHLRPAAILSHLQGSRLCRAKLHSALTHYRDGRQVGDVRHIGLLQRGSHRHLRLDRLIAGPYRSISLTSTPLRRGQSFSFMPEEVPSFCLSSVYSNHDIVLSCSFICDCACHLQVFFP